MLGAVAASVLDCAKEMDHIYFIGTLIVILMPSGSYTVCDSSDSKQKLPNRKHLQQENTCDAYCYKVLKPMLEHIGNMQMFWDHCDAGKLSSTTSRLDKLENQLVARAQKEIELETAIKENELKLRKQSKLLERQKSALRKPFQYRFGSKYYYIEEIQKLNWFAAAHRCREYGGDLLSLANQEELNALRSKLNSPTVMFVCHNTY